MQLTVEEVRDYSSIPILGERVGDELCVGEFVTQDVGQDKHTLAAALWGLGNVGFDAAKRRVVTYRFARLFVAYGAAPRGGVGSHCCAVMTVNKRPVCNVNVRDKRTEQDRAFDKEAAV